MTWERMVVYAAVWLLVLVGVVVGVLVERYL